MIRPKHDFTTVQLSSDDIATLVEQLAPAIAERLAKQPRLVTREKFAEMTGLSTSYVDKKIREGVIPRIKSGRRVLIDPGPAIEAMKT